jgi:hypothetical protein
MQQCDHKLLKLAGSLPPQAFVTNCDATHSQEAERDVIEFAKTRLLQGKT